MVLLCSNSELLSLMLERVGVSSPCETKLALDHGYCGFTQSVAAGDVGSLGPISRYAFAGSCNGMGFS
jgi:hypothetical protein